jgi:hypothetical protein
MNGMERVAIIVLDTGYAATDIDDAAALKDRLVEKRFARVTSALTAKEKAAFATADSVGVFTLSTKGDSSFKGGDQVAKAIAGFLGKASSYGLYVIMHGDASGFPSPANKSALYPASIGKFLRKIVDLQGTQGALKKVNLVACNLGAPPNKQTLKPAGGFYDEAYGSELCKTLANEGTMIAAYTVPVYVYREGNPELVGGSGVPATRTDPDSKRGQKLVEPLAPGQSSLDYATRLAADNRATFKKVWTWNNGAVSSVAMDVYHAHR